MYGPFNNKIISSSYLYYISWQEQKGNVQNTLSYNIY